MGKGIIFGRNNVKNNLPFVELEYIESTGTQYIDTGYIVNSNTKIELDFTTTTIPSNSDAACIFIATPTWVYQSFSLFYRKSSGNMTFHGNEQNFGTYLANTNYHFEGTMGGNGTLTNTDAGTSVTTSLGTNSGLSNLCLFGISSDTARRINIKLKSCKIYTGTTLERDIVPVINTQSLEVGLFDKVNQTFYKNAGTGTFKCAFKSFNEASKCCEWMNYLQSNGDQYIDTLISNKTNGFYGESEVAFLNTSGPYLVGCHNLNSPYERNGFGLCSSVNTTELGLGDVFPQYVISPFTLDTKYSFIWNTKKSGGYAKLNNNVISSSTDATGRSALNLLILTNQWYLNANNYKNNLKCKIYNLKIYEPDESTLLRDFVPFKFKESSICGLYDKVENKIYLNAGTGSFTCG